MSSDWRPDWANRTVRAAAQGAHAEQTAAGIDRLVDR